MANDGGSGNSKVTVDKQELTALIESLDVIASGDLSKRADVEFKDASLQELQGHINGLVSTLEQQNEQFHEATMDQALGLSECFQALAEVRAGNLAARVSDAMLESNDELMSNLGKTLNATVADFEEQMSTIQQQQSAIEHLVKQLQTPLLQLWDDVLALPVIGMVDTKRSAEMMETLLTEIVSKQVRFVILDVTGVDVVDTKTADHFIKVMKSAELLGTRCILTGIRPAVAQTLVELGVDLSSISTLRNLEEGLRECLRTMESEKIAANKAKAR